MKIEISHDEYQVVLALMEGLEAALGQSSDASWGLCRLLGAAVGITGALVARCRGAEDAAAIEELEAAPGAERPKRTRKPRAVSGEASPDASVADGGGE